MRHRNDNTRCSTHNINRNNYNTPTQSVESPSLSLPPRVKHWRETQRWKFLEREREVEILNY